jgi:succinyl-CoA synthetase beta subunit
MKGGVQILKTPQ